MKLQSSNCQHRGAIGFALADVVPIVLLMVDTSGLIEFSQFPSDCDLSIIYRRILGEPQSEADAG